MGSSKEVFTVVVEIPKGSRNKYEYDHESGATDQARACLDSWRDHERWAILAEDRQGRIKESGRTT